MASKAPTVEAIGLLWLFHAPHQLQVDSVNGTGSCSINSKKIFTDI